jgi:hypothetical protein
MKGRPLRGGDAGVSLRARPGHPASMKGRPLRGGDRVPILRLPTWPFGRWPRRLPSTAPDFASEPGLASWACRLPVVSCAKGAWVPAGRWRVRGIVHRSSGPWPVIAGARPRKSIALRGSPASGPRSQIRAWSSLVSMCRWEGSAQPDDLGGLGVDDEDAVLDPVAIGLQGVRDPVPPVIADDVVGDEESVYVVSAHLVAMPL